MGKIDIETRDGLCRSYVYRPAGAGPWPAVLVFMDGLATYPEQIVAAASYHGGRLASDDPDSPHRLAPRMQARVYVAGAIEGPSFPDDMKQRLEEALTDAGVDHEIETYPAKHGWVFCDFPVYDAAAAERHWKSMLALFAAKLPR